MHSLILPAPQDDELNELLPFGEYVAPESHSSPAFMMGLDAWELDRLLTRLALQNQAHTGGGRRARSGRHHHHHRSAELATASAAGSSSSRPVPGVDARSSMDATR
jgi:hypothetical protein